MKRIETIKKKWIICTALLGGAATISLALIAAFSPMAVDAGGGHN